MIQLAPPQSTAAEWQAFEWVCQRLSGFDDLLSYEYVDGFLAALASGPQAAEPPAWLPVLCGDTFERVFADPADQAQAQTALQARLRLLRRALDPEALFEQPEALRLDPYVMEWTDEQRQMMRDAGVPEAQLAELEIGSAWGEGFLRAVQDLPPLWPQPPDEEAAGLVQQALDQVRALTLAPGGEPMQAHLAKYYAGRGSDEPVTRDDLLAEACMSVQDLRMFCVDFAPVPATRRVETTPGRNDPCPCGSGKKFKKCHGAAA